MADTKFPQNSQNNKNSKEERTRSEFLRNPHGDVLQDKYGLKSVRFASSHAQPGTKCTRTDKLDKNSDRVKKQTGNHQRVHKAIWVTRPISILIDLYALTWGVTPSRAGERLIELGLEHNILRAHLQLIIEVIRDTIREECRRFFGRLTGIIFRMYLLLSRIFHLQKNLLGRSGLQNRLTVAQLDKIIAWSADLARKDVVSKTGARSQALDRAIEEWLASDTGSDPKQDGDGEETDKQN